DRPALVFIQDYHLALAAKYLKDARPDIQVALFWHIPWPNPEVFRVLPWGQEVLEGMLANDVLGFHIRRHALNFMDCVSETLEARVDAEHMAVDRGGRRTWVRPFAISVDAEDLGMLADSPDTVRAAERVRHELGAEGCRVVLGVDRLDYTKGLPERFAAYDRFLEKHAHWRGRTVFIQVAVPSRIELPEYRSVGDSVRAWTQTLNRRYPREAGPTVHLIERNLDFQELVPLYRLADVCMVTSLHDGMNLVAKEYVAAQDPADPGVLVLSRFAGAAEQLTDALLVNPYDTAGMADAIQQALRMPRDERILRHERLLRNVREFDVHWWARDFLQALQAEGV
ncbi:MAG TPA: trehalose-6-phosphate synthase, partial [Gemmatimonadales bacterium]|nr:trehalose-6-phosphate synthase [Gemmatimonadales bacterium]